MDWNFFWTLVFQVILASVVLRIALIPWEYWVATAKAAAADAERNKGEKIL